MSSVRFRKRILGGGNGTPAPTLTAPAAVTDDTTPDITVNAVTGAATYQFQVSTVSNFASTVADATQAGTTYTVSPALSADTIYYIRVRAYNASNVPGAWSATATTYIYPAQVTPTETELWADGGLENWNSATDLVSFSESLAGTSTLNREATTKRSGNFAARMDIDASNSAVVCTQALTVAAKTWLRARGYLRSSVAGRSGRIVVANITPGILSISGITTDWTEGVSSGIISAANPSADFRRDSGTSSSLYFDDLSIVALTLATQMKVTDVGAAFGTIESAITRAAGTQAGLIHYSDADNYVLAYLNGGGNLVLMKIVGGTLTASVASVAVTYGAAKIMKLEHGADSYTVTYDGSVVINAAAVTDAVFNTTTNFGIFTTLAANSFGNVKFVPN